LKADKTKSVLTQPAIKKTKKKRTIENEDGVGFCCSAYA